VFIWSDFKSINTEQSFIKQNFNFTDNYSDYLGGIDLITKNISF